MADRFFRYFIAGMVVFSGMYLGDHYPGDVMSGSRLGMIFAMFFRWPGRLWRKRLLTSSQWDQEIYLNMQRDQEKRNAILENTWQASGISVTCHYFTIGEAIIITEI
ncbi:MAG TPA: hypothetical protein VFZ43_09995 [Anaerolineales bacterium]